MRRRKQRRSVRHRSRRIDREIILPNADHDRVIAVVDDGRTLPPNAKPRAVRVDAIVEVEPGRTKPNNPGAPGIAWVSVSVPSPRSLPRTP